MQIFLPTTIFQCKINKKESSYFLRTLHITKDYVVFTNTKTITKAYCKNDCLEKELNIDFEELKNIIKIGKKKNDEISFFANVKEKEVEIIYKDSKNATIKGIVSKHENFLDYKKLFDNSNFLHEVKLSKNFSQLALFNEANKIIEFQENFIIAKIGNARIAKENIGDIGLNGKRIGLSKNYNSLINIDTTKGATWHFKDANSPYRITQDNVDIIEMPTIL